MKALGWAGAFLAVVFAALIALTPTYYQDGAPLQPIPSTVTSTTTVTTTTSDPCGTNPAGRDCVGDPCAQTGQKPGAPWGVCNGSQPTTTPTWTPTVVPEPHCTVHPQEAPEGCGRPDSPPGETLINPPPLSTTTPTFTPAHRGMQLVDNRVDIPDFIAAMNRNGFRVSDEAATVDSGERACGLRASESEDQLARSMYVSSPGVFANLDRARVALSIIERYLCPVAPPSVPGGSYDDRQG